MAAPLHAVLEHETSAPRRQDLELTQTTPSSRSALVKYEPHPDRCIVEAVLRYRRLAPWRVRLGATAVTLTVPTDTGGPTRPVATLSAHIDPRPRYASIPATAGLFLPSTPAGEQVMLTAAIPATFRVGETVTGPAAVTIGRSVQRMTVDVETIENDGDRIIVAITGAVPRRQASPFGRWAMHVDAAIEFHRTPRT